MKSQELPSSASLCKHRVIYIVLLGDSWVVISGFISKVSIIITNIRGPITPLITTHEPPSNVPKP